MAVRKVTKKADIDDLQVGDAVDFDVDLSRFDDDPDGPIKLLDSPEFAKIEKTRRAIEDHFKGSTDD